MEITEKLNIFYSSAIDVANRQSSTDMQEFDASMEKLFLEFKENKNQEFDSRFHIEEGKQRRDLNRKISEELTEEKRKLNLYQQEKKEALFQVVEKLLENYKKTPEYDQYLIAKILMAKKFARKKEVIIYINPTDAEKKEFLEEKTGCELTVSEVEFGGGIRAVVRSKNVLIDESFQTKLSQERDAYTF